MARVLTITPNPALDLTVETPPITLGSVHRSRATQLEPAGKGINLARVLSRLGHAVTVSGLMGEVNAAPFERLFIAERLEDCFVRVSGQNRINVKVAESGGRVTDINGPGFVLLSDAMACFQVRLDSLMDSYDAIVIAGSLPQGFPPGELAALITRFKATGKPVWFDASGDAFATGVIAGPNGVKPNTDELAEWARRPLPDIGSRVQAARDLQKTGIAEVIVSMGAEGVLWLSHANILYASAPQVPVVSTVCAGDTLLAGLIHGRLSELPPQDTLRLATALATESVRHVGVGNPAAADFDDLQQQTRVHPWPGDDNNGERPL